MDVLEIVTLKLKSHSEIPDEYILLAVDEIEQVIKNYCSIDSVPDALKYTWANMAVDSALYNYASNNDGSKPLDDINVGDISSIKIGDTNITLSNEDTTNTSNRAIKSHSLNLDDIVMNYREQLNKFRRMVW